MKSNTKSLAILLFVVLTLLLGISACTDADVASKNLSTAAEMFEIDRRVVFYNGITDTYIFVVYGKCSIEADTLDKQLELTCKTGRNDFKKHYLGLSDNVTYFAEQIDSHPVDEYRYRVIFSPTTILPDIDLKTESFTDE